MLGAGITGGLVALLMQWWTNAVDYPLNISGKPLFSLPANIPVTFELIILFSALTAFFGVLALNGLPRFNNPLLEKERFLRATTDRFFICHRCQRSGVRSAAGARRCCRRPAPRRSKTCTAAALPAKIPLAVHLVGIVVAVPGTDSAAVDRQGPADEIGYAPHASRCGTWTSSPSSSRRRRRRCLPTARRCGCRSPGTIAYGDLRDDDHFYQGQVGAGLRDDVARADPASDDGPDDAWARAIQDLCAPCHGLAGEGDGIASERALAREDSPGWVKPLSLHSQGVREQPVGKIFNTITNGIRTMPGVRVADAAAGSVGDYRLRPGAATKSERVAGRSAAGQSVSSSNCVQ